MAFILMLWRYALLASLAWLGISAQVAAVVSHEVV